jgi:glycosyltransferase involved in cell wall biosynthesis
MHVHNTFAAASPSVYYAAHRESVPVVQTLHNYRLVCPVATTFRDGHACTDCVGRRVAWPSIVHACVRDSRGQSAVVTAMLAIHRTAGTFARRIDQYVALSEFQRDLMIGGGLPRGRVSVIPNFLDPDPGMATGARAGIVYVGRLSVEKGVRPMLEAASGIPGTLRVAGAGPMRGLVDASAAAGNITALGPLAADYVSRELSAAVALLVPSLWFEGFPMVVLEANAVGTPVIASRIGSLAEIVEDGVTGLLVDPNDSQALERAMRWAIAHPDRMSAFGAAARARYEARYRGTAHLASLVSVYRRSRTPGASDA